MIPVTVLREPLSRRESLARDKAEALAVTRAILFCGSYSVLALGVAAVFIGWSVGAL